MASATDLVTTTKSARLMEAIGATYSGLSVWDTADSKMVDYSRKAYKAIAGGREAMVIVQVYVLPDGTPIYDQWTQEGFEALRAMLGGMECYLYDGEDSPSAVVFPTDDESDAILFALLEEGRSKP